MTTTTHQVPWLRAGVGETPADGGCVNQVASWIANPGDWTDQPPCVHPVIRQVAICVNDSLPDDERQQLLDLIPRMLHTATDDEAALARKLMGWRARQIYPVWEEWAKRVGYDDDGVVLACIEAAERGEVAPVAWVAGDAGVAGVAWAAAAAEVTGAAGAALGFLTGLLDEYDRLTARESVEPVDLAPVCEAMAR